MTNNRIAVGSVVEGISGAGYVRTDADGLVLDPGDSPSIAAADIAAGAVTTVKLADDAVTTPKITNLAVTDAKITSLAFSKLTSLPTTLAGYGIASSQTATGTWAFEAIQSGQLVAKSTSIGALVVIDGFTGNDSRVVWRTNGAGKWELTNSSVGDLYLYGYASGLAVAKWAAATGYLALGGNDATHWLDVPSMRIRTGSAPTAADGAIYFDGTNLRLYSGGAWRTITQI